MEFEEERYGVGKGWQPLVEKLHADLLAVNPNYELHQIKEKFGGLRYYVESSEDEAVQKQMFDLIEAAELQSYLICETCGEKGKLRETGWIKTLCDAHHEEREERRRLQWRPTTGSDEAAKVE